MLDESARRSRLAGTADAYARVAVANIRREFPALATYYITGPGPLQLPRDLHPAFHGSLDWHSCVEMHWVLVRLLRLFPSLASAADARAVLAEDLATEKIAAEAAFCADPDNAGFERPYGWGWLLMLAEDLAAWDDADAPRWRDALAPLVDVLRGRFLEWLPSATYPLRTGLHGNSAFGLSLAFAFAERDARSSRAELDAAIRSAATRWFAHDTDYPARFEPSGSDFLSPALTEAELMRRVLDRDAFVAWLGGFLPALATGEPASLLAPAIVRDPSDGQGAHLHGVNLSRAWCMRRIAEALPASDPRIAILEAASATHAEASLGAVVGSHYMVEHWLVAFAVLLLS